jgi:Ca-activated chloride channel family protein
MINFDLPWLMLALPLPLLIYWLPTKSNHSITALQIPQLITGIDTSEQVAKKSKFPLIILSLVWFLLVTSASQPQWLGHAVDIPTEGREMMIAVDLSGSMQIEDMIIKGQSADRLEMLKVVLGGFIERRVGDRLGLILFADDAYMQTPMTYDRKTVKQMLDESVLGLVGTKTAIGDAIALAAKRFDNKKDSNRVLLLLTDGQNTTGKITPEEALELAVAKKMTIYTIGIGADSMIQQSLFGSRRVNPSSELDEEILQKIANDTNGKYFRARDSQSMDNIYQLLDQLEPVEQDQQQMRPLTALFQWPLAVAFILSILYLLWLTKPNMPFQLNKKLSKVNNND